MSIQPLPPDVIAQIKSSISITDLNGVVCELMKNSLDAGSTKIDITIDYARGSCVVEDDGLGILPSEFGDTGSLGKLYHTSKLDPQTPAHGGRGTFLASLSAMALISITSHHHLHRSHNTLSMHKAEVVSRQIPAPSHHYLPYFNHGTRVTVRDLFGNMPVRVKQRAIVAEKRGNSKDWEGLRREVVVLVLSWPENVAVAIRDSTTSQKLLVKSPPKATELDPASQIDITFVCSVLSQATLISHEEKGSWVSVSASTSDLDIHGAISLDPGATKYVQFISFGIHPLVAVDGRSFFHDEINRMFSNSAFGSEEEVEGLDDLGEERISKDGRYKGEGSTGQELKGGKKGVDRWPMFYINIQQTSRSWGSVDMDDVFDERGDALNTVMDLLQVMIFEFLARHHFHPKASRGQRERRLDRKYQPVTDRRLLSSKAERGIDTNSGRSVPPDSSSSARERKSSLKKSGRFNPSITSLKFPSFRQSAPIFESPFDAWSRIKSGASISKLPSSKNAPEKKLACHILRPSTAPLRSASSKSTLATRLLTPDPEKGPLLSLDGRIIRAPFDDRTKLPRRSLAASLQTCQYHDVVGTAVENGDDEVLWINPITKVASLINHRTGLTIPATNGTFNTMGPQTRGLPVLRHNRQASTSRQIPSPWISKLLKSWDNPIYLPTAPSIPHISFDGAESVNQNVLHGRHHHCSERDIDRAFKEPSSGINGQISRYALKNAEVLAQVDRKFVLVKLKDPKASITSTTDSEYDSNMLVLIDQHAADERIRIEALLEELCEPLPTHSGSILTESRILSIPLDKALIFEIPPIEASHLRTHKEHFTNWGILYEVSPLPIVLSRVPSLGKPTQRVTVHALPPGIIERCKIDPHLLIDLIRTEIWKVIEKRVVSTTLESPQSTWLQRIQNCPQGILNMLNSRACRSAIMFNDELSKEQCKTLVQRLAECKFPFQCAHGRPSLVPLVDLGSVNSDNSMNGTKAAERKGEAGFASAFRRWQGQKTDKPCP